jgi:alkanesulfonate monooxygenase SsuD/methylene tetrahydromethanopterin reductase-like flavin-dependent oxidoreductase (luciferase family)
VGAGDERVKYGLFLSAFTSKPLGPLGVAARAAAAGYDSVFVYDHLFPPGGPQRPSVEPFTLLSAAAAANPEVGVGVLVSRALFRAPGMLAKEASALGHLTGGRAVLGLGLGDRFGAAEHQVLQLPYPPTAERAVALEETARAVRALVHGGVWGGGAAIPPIEGPLLPPAAVDVWVGGTGPTAVRAAARAADAWNGWGMADDAFVARVAELAAETAAAGRGPSEVPATWAAIALVGRNADELARLEGERADKGGSLDIWRGTTDDLRRLRDRLEEFGVTWMIPLAAGPADRVELIAETLRS